jgi:16S rRNA processing protein RimM
LNPEQVSFPADAVEVGRVAGAWGLKGWIKVQPFAAEPQALFASRRWFLQPADVPLARGVPALLRVQQSREHGALVVAQAEEIADRDSAEALKGARVFVARSSFPTAGEDEYYWVDLIGCAVVNRQGVLLGQVSELSDTGVHSVLHVRPDGAPERLIPFVAAYIDDVDIAARRIRVDWGLDY